jgi:N-ethylmaleimide reductase
MPTGNMETGEFKQNHVSHAVLAKVRAAFPGAIIWCGGFTSGESAQAALDTGLVDLIAFGRPYIANPDLAERLKHGGRWQKRTVQPIHPTRRGGLHGLPGVSGATQLRRVNSTVC